MATFNLELFPDEEEPDKIWQEVAGVIRDAMRGCPEAVIEISPGPSEGALAVEVTLEETCDPALVRLCLTVPPWRFDP